MTKAHASIRVNHIGWPEPEIWLELPAGTHVRLVRAGLCLLASQTELETPEDQHWTVHVETWAAGKGRVYLELLAKTDAEAGLLTLQRALAVLANVNDWIVREP